MQINDFFMQDSTDILCFQGEHRYLSNFWPAPVRLDDDLYPTVENAYQAAKTEPEHRAVFTTCTPSEAKRLGRKVPIRPDWDLVKVMVMRTLIAQKFAPGSPLAAKLLATGAAHIIEGNTWGDTYWGMCKGRGQNILGKLIMAQRVTLQARPQRQPTGNEP